MRKKWRSETLPGRQKTYSLVIFPPNEAEYDESCGSSTPAPLRKVAQVQHLNTAPWWLDFLAQATSQAAISTQTAKVAFHSVSYFCVCLGYLSTGIRACWCFPNQTDLSCRGVLPVFQVRRKIRLDHNHLVDCGSRAWAKVDNRIFLALGAIICTCFVHGSLLGTTRLLWFLTMFMLRETTVKMMLNLAHLFYTSSKQSLSQ